MCDPEEKVFQFVAITEDEQFTLFIPLKTVLSEIEKTMLHVE